MASDDYWGASYWGGDYWGDSYWGEYGAITPPTAGAGGGTVVSRMPTVKVVGLTDETLQLAFEYLILKQRVEE